MTSRRQFLGGALGTAGVLAAAGTGYGVAKGTEPEAGSTSLGQTVPFYGPHQAGIATPAQDRLAFAAFDVTTTDRDELARLLGTWAAAAAQLTKGAPVGAVEISPHAPPIDTGEAIGLPAARLTITVGFGPSLFDQRFGLGHKRPAALVELPAFAGDTLQPAAPAVTCACRPAPTTRPSPSTRSATSPGSPAVARSSAGRSSASAARPRPRPRSRPNAT
jgi:deferrochelatase/peroxidase EfeB